MIITTRHKLSQIDPEICKLKIDGENIEFVKEIKYLGVILDSCLSFKCHFEFLRKKISKKLYFFSRISKHLTSWAKSLIFKSIIQPHFDYCASILYLLDNSSIESLQAAKYRYENNTWMWETYTYSLYAGCIEFCKREKQN